VSQQFIYPKASSGPSLWYRRSLTNKGRTARS